MGKKETKLDLTWQSTWPKSAIMLLSLVEGIVYKTTFDCSLRTAVRAQKSCEECLEYQAFAEKVSDMEEQLESENNEPRRRGLCLKSMLRNSARTVHVLKLGGRV